MTSAVRPIISRNYQTERAFYRTAVALISPDGEKLELKFFEGLPVFDDNNKLKLSKNSPFKKNYCNGKEHPSLEKAAESIETNEQMLAFLKKNRDDPSFKSSVIFFHEDYDRYKGHVSILPNNPTEDDMREHSHLMGFGIHPHTLDEMIEFEEMIVNNPHYHFNKAGECLRRVYSKLYNSAKFPILGIFPAALKALLGVAQMVLGISLSILSAPFACFTERGSIILQRSLRHIAHGPANILDAMRQAIVHGIFFGALWGVK
jgi:hypothetical protein